MDANAGDSRRPAGERGTLCDRKVERPRDLSSARGEFDPVDDHTLMRARGWALALGLAYVGSSRGDEAMRTLGLATIDAALNDE